MADPTLNYGLELAKLRAKAKVTQAELADRLGMSFQALSKIERGGSISRKKFVSALKLLGFELREKIVKIN